MTYALLLRPAGESAFYASAANIGVPVGDHGRPLVNILNQQDRMTATVRAPGSQAVLVGPLESRDAGGIATYRFIATKEGWVARTGAD